LLPGSHVIHVLQQSRRFKVISVDNFHNAHPKVYERLTKIARDALPADTTAQERDSAEIETYDVDLINADAIRSLFAKYGKGGIWGVVHIAVRDNFDP
jgi:UDP-glucose 4-epimerase